MSAVLHAIIEPGFFASGPVRMAAAVGALAAIVAASVGVFTVIRGQAFAGEALGDIGASGGASSYLVGVGALWGFAGSSIVAAALMELLGTQRGRGRDLATGVVLGAGFGLTALLLYLGTTYDNTSGAAVTILFGSIFTLDPSVLPAALGLALLVLAMVALVYRPLLLASISPELAAARGIPVRTLGAVYLLSAALAVALSAVTIGAILSTALLIGPAAAALQCSSRPLRAIAAAAAIGVAVTWLGLLAAYDSYYWPPLHHGWPASFLIVAFTLIAYLGARVVGGRRRTWMDRRSRGELRSRAAVESVR